MILLLPSGKVVNFTKVGFILDKWLVNNSIYYRCYAMSQDTGDVMKKMDGTEAELSFESKDPSMSVGMMLTWLTAKGYVDRNKII